MEKIKGKYRFQFKGLYILDENHQMRQNINWLNSYGKLQKGIYRIEKEADGNVFYSNEFIIK